MYKFTRLTIIICLLCYSQCFSQIKIGIKAGLNVSLMEGNNYFTNYAYSIERPIDLPAYHLGIVSEVPILKHLSLQPEIIYSTAGYKYFSNGERFNSMNSTTDPDVTEYLSFVSLPILIKVKLAGVGFLFGPQIDRLVLAQRKIHDYEKANASRDYNMGNTYSAVIGLDYTFRFGLGFHARYTHGLQSISKVTEIGIYEPGTSIKNNAAMFGLHFLFGKSKF